MSRGAASGQRILASARGGKSAAGPGIRAGLFDAELAAGPGFIYCNDLAAPISVVVQTKQNLMSDKPIEERVKEIIVKELSVNPEQVTPTASFIEDLGADSLDTVELVMAFEEEFGVEVPDEEAEKLQTVGDVVKYIEANSTK